MGSNQVDKGMKIVGVLIAGILAAPAIGCSEHVVGPVKRDGDAGVLQNGAGVPTIPFTGNPQPSNPRLANPTGNPVTGTGPGGTTTSACQPLAVGGPASPWVQPNPVQRHVCSAAEAQVVATCFTLGGQYCQNLNAVNPACQSCAVTPAASPTYGALVQVDQSSPAQPNITGCVGALTGNPTASGCGAKLESEIECEANACARCADADRGACANQAAATVCAAQRQASSCADQALATCLQGQSAADQAINLVAIFCM